MSSDRCIDALAQCLPRIFHNRVSCTTIYQHGYRNMADQLDTALEGRGFKIISIATYNRLTKQAETLYRSDRSELVKP